VWFPRFATDRLHRVAQRGDDARPRERAPHASAPLVTAVTAAGVRRVTAVDRAAEAGGIAPGMTLADARALEPTLAVVEAAPAADAAALARLADWCVRYTPWVALDPADACGGAGLWLDIAGCAHLFGGEAALLDDLTERLHGLGFGAQAGLADTAGAAWAWARFSARAGPDAILAPGAQGEAIAWLPVAALRLGAADVAMLDSLGLRTIGDLARLPRPAVAARFGDAVLRRLDQALGLVAEPIAPRRLPAPFRAALAFAEPILTHDSIVAATQRLIRDLCGQLASRESGARRLTLIAYRSDGTTAAVALGASQPTREPAHLMRLFGETLGRIDPGFGLDAMTLEAAAAPLGPQANALTLPPPADADARWMPGSSDATPAALNDAARCNEPHACRIPAPDLTQLFDVLGLRLGHECVMRLAARASHVPERAVARVAPAAPPLEPNWPIRQPRPLRLLKRPEPIAVTAPVPDAPPLQFVWRRIAHRVRHADGPERIAGEWWRDDAPLRDYYRIEDMSGRRFWVYREGLDRPGRPARWFLHGVFA
jgi:protein ImuB